MTVHPVQPRARKPRVGAAQLFCSSRLGNSELTTPISSWTSSTFSVGVQLGVHSNTALHVLEYCSKRKAKVGDREICSLTSGACARLLTRTRLERMVRVGPRRSTCWMLCSGSSFETYFESVSQSAVENAVTCAVAGSWRSVGVWLGRLSRAVSGSPLRILSRLTGRQEQWAGHHRTDQDASDIFGHLLFGHTCFRDAATDIDIYSCI